MDKPTNLAFSFVMVDGKHPGALAAGTPERVQGEVKERLHPSNEPGYKPGTFASFAHDWSSAGTGGKLRIHGRHIIDAYGRVCNLRGVNISGANKTPVNDNHETFPANPEAATFVGRPFPLEEAHEHFSRLRRWGFTFIRFLVTWEAVEHAGVGKYDTEYLGYLRSLLSLLPMYGMTAFVEMHQDVWSRYSGGSGAPAWTLEAVGFDLNNLHDSGSAWLLGVKGGGHSPDEQGVWPCGYHRLAASTMATLFWAGDMFAPKLRVKDKSGQEVPVQHFLQNAFLDAYEQLVRAVGDLEGVIGFEMMNEPHRGYIALPSLHRFDYNKDLHLAYVPSAFQSFMLGAGHPTLVPYWTRSFPVPTRLTSHKTLNAKGVNAWRADGPTQGKCLWEMHGVWGWDNNKNEGVILRENYFRMDPATGKEVDWYTDLYYPFLHRWASRVLASSSPQKFLFAEPIPNEFCPASWTRDCQLPNMVFSPHWYDLNALFIRSFDNFTVNVQGITRGMFPLRAFYWGQKGARDNYALQVRNLVEASYQSLGEVPVILGECGIPMDMNKGQAFSTGDWTWQTRCMDALMWALEQSLIGVTLWNYNPHNDDLKGDDWNGENFSWFSSQRVSHSQQLQFEQTSTSLDDGAVLLPAAVRPYPAKTAGIPLKFEYEVTRGRFVYEWAEPVTSHPADVARSMTKHTRVPLTGHPPLASRETEIFVPSTLSRGRQLIVSGLQAGDVYAHDEARQTLFVIVAPGNATHKISVAFEPPPTPMFNVNGFWGDFGPHVCAAIAIMLSVLAYGVLA